MRVAYVPAKERLGGSCHHLARQSRGARNFLARNSGEMRARLPRKCGPSNTTTDELLNQEKSYLIRCTTLCKTTTAQPLELPTFLTSGEDQGNLSKLVTTPGYRISGSLTTTLEYHYPGGAIPHIYFQTPTADPIWVSGRLPHQALLVCLLGSLEPSGLTTRDSPRAAVFLHFF
jgi:hypothetical protein